MRSVSMLVRCAVPGLLILSTLMVDGSRAAAEESIDFTHTLLLRRPLMEREVETQAGYRSGALGRLADVTIALDVPLLPRWQIEVALPLFSLSVPHQSSTAGIGDLTVENKVLLGFWPEHRLMVSAGLDVVLPTGSSDRRLGGAVGFAPFVVAGLKLGAFAVLADLAYRSLFRPSSLGGDLQQLTTGIAVAHPLTRTLTPFLEFTTLTNITADRGLDARLRRRPQFYLTPGLNIRIAPGFEMLLGLEAPVGGARTFDLGGRIGLIVDF